MCILSCYTVSRSVRGCRPLQLIGFNCRARIAGLHARSFDPRWGRGRASAGR